VPDLQEADVTEQEDPHKERPVEREPGIWDALDSNGYGHVLGYPTRELVEAWLDGYERGAEENM
jgi:hypothetical protein